MHLIVEDNVHHMLAAMKGECNCKDSPTIVNILPPQIRNYTRPAREQAASACQTSDGKTNTPSLVHCKTLK